MAAKPTGSSQNAPGSKPGAQRIPSGIGRSQPGGAAAVGGVMNSGNNPSGPGA